MDTANVKLLKDQDTGKDFYSWNILGQAYILSLKDGNNSIIIVGASNAAYDPNMTELDPSWAKAVKNSKEVV